MIYHNAIDEDCQVISGRLFGKPLSADNRLFLTREKYDLWQFVSNLVGSARSEIVISTGFLTFGRADRDVVRVMKDKIWRRIFEPL